MKGYINKTFQDGKGRHWILTRTAGFTILGGRSFSTKDGLPSNDVRDVYEMEPGKYWIATIGGLVEMHESAAGVNFRTYTTANGLTDDRIYHLQSDAAGNLWIGTNHAGIQRMPRNGFISFGVEDGVRLGELSSFAETQSGDLLLVTGDNGWRTLHSFDGMRFHAVPLPLPKGAQGFGWGWNQHVFEDKQGWLWLPALHGVYRYPPLEDIEDLRSVPPEPVREMQQIGCSVSRLYQDSHSNVWIATTSDVPCEFPDQLFVWKRESGEVHHFNAGKAAWPKTISPMSFAEDHTGNEWIGLTGSSGLVRIRNGHAERFTASDGIPRGAIEALICDGKDRL